ncbi:MULTISPECIES: hypothetical protein [Micromonospora]|uniref:hypothetical protein n=1 Tax=Micromonospora TaxID=1873 RepID=UPI0031D9D754
MSVRRRSAEQPDDADRLAAERGFWLAIALLTAALVGSATALLTWQGGMSEANAILAGGASFGGTTVLVVQLVQFMRGKHR